MWNTWCTAQACIPHELSRIVEGNHRTQCFAAVHGLECLFSLVEADQACDHFVEVEPALLVPRRQQREIAGREAVAVPGDAEVTAEVEELLEWQFQRRPRPRNADQHARSCQVAAEERLLDGFRTADRFEGVVHAVSTGEFL